MSTMKKFGPAALAFASTMLFPALALAAGPDAALAGVQQYAAGGAGFAIGIGVLGGALGQGRAVAAALEGIARNPGSAPRVQTPMILGLALFESLVLLSFVVAFVTLGGVLPKAP